jgi:FlaA1/EpsC-like NDP-sugar epimerase
VRRRNCGLSLVRPFLVVFDLVLLSVGLLAAVAVRFEGVVPPLLLSDFLREALPVLPFALVVFYACGLYNRVWSYASVDSLVALVTAVSASAVLLAISMGVFTYFGLGVTSFSLLVLSWLLWLLLLGGSRFLWRLVHEFRPSARREPSPGSPGRHRPPPPRQTRVLIYGAGAAGAALADQILYQRGNGLQLLGFIDDDPRKRGLLIRHGRVLGAGQDLKRVLTRHPCDQILVAIPSLSGPELRRITGHCTAAGVPFKILPPVLQLWENQVSFGELREVDVADLLGRDPAQLPYDTCGAYLRGKRVLVTGAGGSIGSEVCRQIARFHPEQIVLMGRGENRIHAIHREIERHYPGMSVPFIGNLTSRASVEEVFQTYAPQVVFHAAAHKHVPLMEPQPLEAITNNVFGTENLAAAAARHRVELFVMTSTDKAVSPSSVMGASKRLCELILQWHQWQVGFHTRFVTVRFGNVLGSEGSVIRIFRDQIQRGEPLTITHPLATRYFMTIPEAALLVLHAGGLGQPSGLYVLDMGEPVAILKLAEEMLRLAGRDTEAAANFRFTGLRPGEKLHESLHSDEEVLERTSPHLLQVRPNGWMQQIDTVEDLLNRLRGLVNLGDAQTARSELLQMANNQYVVEKTIARLSLPLLDLAPRGGDATHGAGQLAEGIGR